MNTTKYSKSFTNAIKKLKLSEEHRSYVASRLASYPQIGVLSSGKFYAYVGGYSEDRYKESYFLTAITDAIDDHAKGVS